MVLLGCSGSIGRQALEVIRALPGLRLVGLAARSSVDATLEQSRDTGASVVAFADGEAAARARQAVGAAARPRVLSGEDGVAALIAEAAANAARDGVPLTVLNGVVGAAGLRATMATLEAGVTLALANKESMVAGGEFVLRAARKSGAAIVPVDSEHSAVFQCLRAGRPAHDSGNVHPAPVTPDTPRLLDAEEIVLTGSGGPFRGFTRSQLAEVTREQALRHPNWVMGPKTTVDSATLMNKGLEVIEAHYLFGAPYERIRVLVHPQSLVHALVRFADGALLAHLGEPDMRTPIGYALTFPERAPLPMVNALELAGREITFEEPDVGTFRCLALAREAGRIGGGAPVALNAANEVAVAAFLAGGLPFLDIEMIVELTLEYFGGEPLASLDDVFEADREARRFADEAARSRRT